MTEPKDNSLQTTSVDPSQDLQNPAAMPPAENLPTEPVPEPPAAAAPEGGTDPTAPKPPLKPSRASGKRPRRTRTNKRRPFLPVVCGAVGIVLVLVLGLAGIRAWNPPDELAGLPGWSEPEAEPPAEQQPSQSPESGTPSKEEPEGHSSDAESEEHHAATGESEEHHTAAGESSALPVLTLTETSAQVFSAGEIFETVSPSIVGIQTYEPDDFDNEQLYSSGSGIVLSQDGYILTNAHVITNDSARAAQRIEVILRDTGEVLPATFLGADSQSDLALIRVDADSLIPAEFADSADCRVGDTAYVIGSPTGETLANSMTSGIISGINREITTEFGTMVLLQTDAAVNPGNSGGALLNDAGQVVGVVSSKIVETSFEGIGFAIPSAVTQTIINDIAENGYVTGRVRIGITYQTVNETVAERGRVPKGIRVVAVDESCDAYGKLFPGDIILTMDGENPTDAEAIAAVLAEKSAGDSIRMEVFRVDENGREATITVEVTVMEDTTKAVSQS